MELNKLKGAIRCASRFMGGSVNYQGKNFVQLNCCHKCDNILFCNELSRLCESKLDLHNREVASR